MQIRSSFKTTPALVVAAFLAAALATVPTPAFAAAAAHGHPVAIGVARTLPLGTVVTVEGTVSTPAGDFNSSFFDQGFAVQDRTGGVFVSLQVNLGLQVRQKVRVTGALADSGGLLILVPAAESDVVVRGMGPEIEPLFVATGAIGEATEGKIVEVVGHITQPVEDDLPYGYKISVDDGSGEIRVFVNLETGIDVSQFAQGQRVRVIGFSGQYGDYEIDPRFPSDIRVQGHHH